MEMNYREIVHQMELISNAREFCSLCGLIDSRLKKFNREYLEDHLGKIQKAGYPIIELLAQEEDFSFYIERKLGVRTYDISNPKWQRVCQLIHSKGWLRSITPCLTDRWNNLPLPTECVSAFIANDAFQFGTGKYLLNQDERMRSPWAEAGKLLVPGGILLARVEAIGSYVPFPNRLLVGGSTYRITGGVFAGIVVHQYSKKEIMTIAHELGMDVEKFIEESICLDEFSRINAGRRKYDFRYKIVMRKKGEMPINRQKRPKEVGPNLLYDGP